MTFATLGDFGDGHFSDEIMDALLMVDRKYRAPFLLGVIEGIPDYEIAEILGIKIGTVKSRIHRSRIRLESALRKFDSFRDRPFLGRVNKISKEKNRNNHLRLSQQNANPNLMNNRQPDTKENEA